MMRLEELNEQLRYIPLLDILVRYMESISLKLPEELLESSARHAKAMGIPRAQYIRLALERMNREVEARALAEQMSRASRKVRKESMRVNAEFARIERDPDA